MRKLALLIAILLVVLSCWAAAQNNYATAFPLTQNPISEAGNWVNGTPGLQTFGGHVGGTNVTPSCPPTCADSFAVLAGTWTADQAGCATVFIAPGANRTTGHYEVEIHLHQTTPVGNNTGYEFNYSLNSSGPYMQIVRWDPGGAFFVFTGIIQTSPLPVLNNGDVFCASAIAGKMTSWLIRPGTGLIATTTSSLIDSTYTGGAPGLGIFNAGILADNANYGFSRFEATNLAAQTAGQADVLAVINGSLHVATNGESVLLPPGTPTWTGGITIPAGAGIQIYGYGLPSGDPTLFTASATCSATSLSLNTNRASALSATPLATAATLRLSCMSISLASGSNGGFGLSSLGACTGSTCSPLRIDNITWNNWCGNNNVFGINQIGDMFGVVDHNTVNGCAAGGVNDYSQLVEISNASYLDSSKFWGDNSWALPENYGSANFLFFENNTFTGSGCCENEQRVGAFQNQGGTRAVARFNKYSKTDGDNFSLGWHGTESNGRPRGGRAFEFYGNALTYGATCNGQGTNCPPAVSVRSGTGIAWGNTMNSATTNLSKLGGVFGLNFLRVNGSINWGTCDGTNAQDGNDPAGVQFTGTVNTWTLNSSNSAGVMTFTTPPSWTPNQWAPYGAPYSMHDVTQTAAKGLTIGQEIQSNDATTLTLVWASGFSTSPVPGDTIQITRAFWCMDQGGGRGAGIYQSPHGLNAVPPFGFAFSNEVLSPAYFFMNSYPASLPSSAEVQADYGKAIPNREWYNEGLNQGVQTSSTFPFNGLSDSQSVSSYVCSASSCTVTVPSTASFQVNGPFQVVNTTRNSVGVSADNSGAITSLTGTTITYPNHEGFANSAGAGGFLITVGAGHGTKARRPATCATGVSYWATDEGNWNQSGNGFGQGNLYICTATNTWTLSYTPQCYPHILVTNGVSACGAGTPGISLSPSSVAFGSVLVGSTSPSSFVTLTNTGSALLNINSITITGTNPTDFAQTNNCGTGVAIGGSCTITTTCTPASAASFSALISVSDNAAGSPHTVGLTCTGTTAAPGISFGPTSLTFAAQTVGTSSSPQAITVTNTGSGNLVISGVAITGTNATSFSQTNNCGTVTPAGTCTINVTFKPQVAGALSANVSVTDNAPASPQTVPLSGTGSGVAAIGFNPTNLAFGNETVSVTSSALSVTVSNPGGAPLTLSSITLTGTNAADFAISANTCGGSLAVNASCVVSVTFTPGATGARVANLTFTDNAPASPQNVALTGNGTQAGTSFSPTSLSFGNQTLNTTSAPQTTTLTNTGSATLNISSIAITGTNASSFAISSKTCGATLAASSSCTVSVTFTPLSVSTLSANLSFTDDAPGSPQAVPLIGAGVGTGQIAFSPASLGFPSTVVGHTSAAQTITVTNSGPINLTISSVTTSGDFFLSSNTCITTLTPAQTCTVTVTFSPSAIGTRSSNVVFTDTAPGSPQSVPVSGTGTQAGAVLSPTSLAFGNQPVGTTSAGLIVNLANNGTATLNISSINIGGTNPSYFAKSGSCGFTLAAGNNCNMTITFSPQTAIAASAALVFTDDGPGSPQSVPLTGTGTSTALSFNPASVTFPNTALTVTSAPLTVQMQNTGNGVVTISSIAISGTNASDFAQTNNCGASLAGNSSCTVTLRFTPSGNGSRAANLVFTDSAPASPQTVSLQGTGFTPAPVVSLSMATVTFGNQTTGTASNPQVVIATNTGTASLSISASSITGTNAGDFGDSSTCGGTLAVNASCTYSFVFTPTAAGSRSATFNLTTNAPSSVDHVSLSGTGVSSPNGAPAPQVFGIDLEVPAFKLAGMKDCKPSGFPNAWFCLLED